MMIAAQAPNRRLAHPDRPGRSRTCIDRSFVSAFPEANDPDTVATLLRKLVARPQLINKMTVQRALDLMTRPHAREALRRIGAGLIAEENSFAEAATGVAALGLLASRSGARAMRSTRWMRTGPACLRRATI